MQLRPMADILKIDKAPIGYVMVRAIAAAAAAAAAAWVAERAVDSVYIMNEEDVDYDELIDSE